MAHHTHGLRALRLVLPLLFVAASGAGNVQAQTTEELIEEGYVHVGKVNRVGLGTAHDLFLQALERANSRGDVEGKALARLALGRVRLEIRDGLGAAAYLELARELFRSLEDRSKEAETEVALGEAYGILAETEEARSSFERALELGRSVPGNAPRITARAHAGLARSFAGRYAYDEAVHHLERARRAWRDLGGLRRFRDASLELGRLELRLGRPRQAIGVLTEATKESQGASGKTASVEPEAVRAYFHDLHDPPEAMKRELEASFEGFRSGGVPGWAKEFVRSEPPTFQDEAYASRRREILRRTHFDKGRLVDRSADRSRDWVAPSPSFADAFVGDCAELHARLPDQSEAVRKRLAREVPGESDGQTIFTLGKLNFRKLTPAWPSECGPRKDGFDPEAVEILEAPERSQSIEELYPELAHRSIEEAIAEREAKLEESGIPHDANLMEVLLTASSEQKQLLKDLATLRAHQAMSKIAETVMTVETTHGMKEKLDLARIAGEGMPRALHGMAMRAGGRGLVTEKHLETVEGMCRQAQDVDLLDTLSRAWSELGPSYAEEAEAAREASWRAQEPLLEGLSFFGLPTERLHLLRQRGEPFLALESCTRRSSFIDRRRIALWRGRIGLAEGDLPLASALFEGAWRGGFVERINNPVDGDSASILRTQPELEIEALMGLAEAHEGQGLPAIAVLYYRKAIELAESMRGSLREERMARSFAGVQTGLYGRLIDLLVDMGEEETAFDYAERARARAFLDLIGNQRLDLRGASAELNDAWNDLRRELAEVQGAVRELGPTAGGFGRNRGQGARARRLRRRQEALEARLEELQGEIRRRHPATASFVTVEPVSLEALSGLLERDGTTFLSYYLTPTRGLAWIVEPGVSRLVELDVDRAKIQSQVRWVRREIASRGRPVELLESLHEKLVAPLVPSISGERLIVVPHGPLHSLPFAALRDPATGRYLVEDFSLTLLPSASVFLYVQKRRNPWEERPLVLGDPDGSLPAAGHEARTVAELYGAEPLLGPAARESRVRAAAGTIDVLHLAAHGHFSERRPLFSHVALAPGDEEDPRDDGRLEVLEIMNELRLEEANLVVLSACNSSVGRQSRGDDVVSMPRALLYAGSPSVVSTLWSIDDRASARLMASFHRRLRTSSAGAAEALRGAQLDLLREESTAAPYFWAAFTLTGDPRSCAEGPVRSAGSSARPSAAR